MDRQHQDDLNGMYRAYYWPKNKFRIDENFEHDLYRYLFIIQNERSRVYSMTYDVSIECCFFSW
jgi:hypothetical protein